VISFEIVVASDAQRAFWANTARYKAFVGGVASGKSFAGVIEILQQPPRSVGVVVAPTYSMLRDATFQALLDLDELCREAGHPLIKRHNDSRFTTTLVNGTRILWRSGDKPDRLRGPNLHWAWADEAAYLDEGVWDVLLGRLRLGRGVAWITTTPRGRDWIWKRWVEEERPQHALFQSHTRDNAALPTHFVQALAQNYKGAWADQELGGAFVDWSAGFIERGWFRQERLVPPPTSHRAWDLAASEDRRADETASVRGWWAPGGVLCLTSPVAAKLEWPRAKPFICQTAEAELTRGVTVVGVEQVAAWKVAVDDLQQQPVFSRVTLRRLHVQGDKVANAAPWAARAAAGKVVLDVEHDWSGWLEQWAGFPLKPHDDRVDAVSRLVQLLGRPPEGEILYSNGAGRAAVKAAAPARGGFR